MNATPILYGLANCDRVRAARRWLADHGIVHRFHDLRRDGLDPATLDGWIAARGCDALINRSGTTWRGLSPDQREMATAADARRLLLAHVALIRRPVVDVAGRITVGFSPERFTHLFLADKEIAQ